MLIPHGLAQRAVAAASYRRFLALKRKYLSSVPYVWPLPVDGDGFWVVNLPNCIFDVVDFVAVARARRERVQRREDNPGPLGTSRDPFGLFVSSSDSDNLGP